VDRLGVGVDEGAHVDAPSSLSGRPATEGGTPGTEGSGRQQPRRTAAVRRV
jgi:hypothetical protein